MENKDCILKNSVYEKRLIIFKNRFPLLDIKNGKNIISNLFHSNQLWKKV